MEAEKFINDILNSTNEITKVSPNDELLSKIELRIHEKSVVPMKTLWLVAASIVILMSLNIVILSTKNKTYDTSITELEKSIHKSNQLY
ncbi:hypothetical protein [Flavobacterium sp.]|uniref:hypothetical protein n=1 Tax=Flavobacterium sp. TaxID=239 RepID=UPI002B4B176C|nr:hypothetical protein [Flavobacterium sp.]HLP65258.1 hypothetical protein [Flavobacterium sp.]